MSTDTGHVIFASLHSKISKRKAVVGIVGLGYVGLPLAYTLHSSEFRIYGYDTDATKIASLKAGKSYIRHIPPERTSELAASRNFIPTTTFSDLGKCEVVIICLPTPVGTHNEPDMSYVLTSCANLANILEPGTLIILESTTYPGATDTELVKLLSRSGQRCGEEFFVAYSPEREDPGNKDFPTKNIPKLVGGVDCASTALARLFYIRGGFEHTVEVSSARVAECAKLLENTYRAVNIALVNELKGVFESMDVNIWEVLDAASTKPFGFQRFNPGPGIGGHCIPVDPFYLTWKGKETGAPCNFIELAALVNASMPKRVVDKVQLALNSDRKAVNGSTILLFGIAYKPDVDDIREAPSLKIWSLLKDMGALVYYHDPLVPIVCRTRKHGHLAGSQSVMLQRKDEGFLNKYDSIVIITNHSCFADFELLKGYKGPVVDTRNCVPAKSELRVVRA